MDPKQLHSSFTETKKGPFHKRKKVHLSLYIHSYFLSYRSIDRKGTTKPNNSTVPPSVKVLTTIGFEWINQSIIRPAEYNTEPDSLLFLLPSDGSIDWNISRGLHTNHPAVKKDCEVDGFWLFLKESEWLFCCFEMLLASGSYLYVKYRRFCLHKFCGWEQSRTS